MNNVHAFVPAMSLLEAKQLAKSYEEGHIQALRGVDLTIAAGEFLAIVGPSGSGKSTLLQLLGGLDSPTSGTLHFRGRPLEDRAGSLDLDTFRARSVGFIFQAFHLLPSLSAIENVQVPMLANKIPSRDREQKGRKLLVELGLEHRLSHTPGRLSAGERQRVAIARSLANDPELLLADEPTGNLDSTTSAKIMEILLELRERRKMTLVMVTHDPRIAAKAPRHISMLDGRVC